MWDTTEQCLVDYVATTIDKRRARSHAKRRSWIVAKFFFFLHCIESCEHTAERKESERLWISRVGQHFYSILMNAKRERENSWESFLRDLLKITNWSSQHNSTQFPYTLFASTSELLGRELWRLFPNQHFLIACEQQSSHDRTMMTTRERETGWGDGRFVHSLRQPNSSWDREKFKSLLVFLCCSNSLGESIVCSKHRSTTQVKLQHRKYLN